VVLLKRQNRWINKKFNELKNIYGNKCMNCGSNNNLEFAHVKNTNFNGKGRGKAHRYYNIVKNLDCYRLWCNDCHNEYDSYQKYINEPIWWGKPYIIVKGDIII